MDGCSELESEMDGPFLGIYIVGFELRGEGCVGWEVWKWLWWNGRVEEMVGTWEENGKMVRGRGLAMKSCELKVKN